MTPRVAALLRSDHMHRFAALPNIDAFPLAEIEALDPFARFLAEHRITTLTAADARAYTQIAIPAKPADDTEAAEWRRHWAQSLADLCRCLGRMGARPALLEAVGAARDRFLHAADYRAYNHGLRRDYRRTVSVSPEALPPDWRATLARLRVERRYSADILARMQQRLCMFVWSAEQADIVPDLGDPHAEQALYEDLVARSVARRVRQGEAAHLAQPRWSYLRSTAEELWRFASAHGCAQAVVARLDRNRRRFDALERKQTPLKMFLSEQAPSATEILADMRARLDRVADIRDPARRHQTRLKICAIGATIPCPPRARDVVDRLFWGDGVYFDAATRCYRYDYENHKTRRRLRMPMDPGFSPFFDALLLGDTDPRYLPQIRDRAFAEKRPVFVRYDGEPVRYGWIGRAWYDVVQSGSHLIRTVLQAELADHGDLGAIYGQMALGHANAVQRAISYRDSKARQKSAAHAGAAMAARAATLSDDISDLL